MAGKWISSFLISLPLVAGACAASTGGLDAPAASTTVPSMPITSAEPISTASTTSGATESSSTTSTTTTVPELPAVLIGAGDIAAEGGVQAATAAIIEQHPDAIVFTTGDNAYPDGTIEEFLDFYQPSWGSFRDRTRPSIGNHDAHSRGATPYFTYFGANAGAAAEGWYAYDIAGWHVIVLNSECGAGGLASCDEQYSWLVQDLERNSTDCMVAYWHKPVFNAGRHPGFESFRDEWAVLDAAGVDFVLNGHDHNYQRFRPLDAAGAPSGDGIRQFIVGSGGAKLYSQTEEPPGLEVFYRGHGVLKIDLYPSSYSWEFLPIEGTFEDSGSDDCTA